MARLITKTSACQSSATVVALPSMPMTNCGFQEIDYVGWETSKPITGLRAINLVHQEVPILRKIFFKLENFLPWPLPERQAIVLWTPIQDLTQ